MPILIVLGVFTAALLLTVAGHTPAFDRAAANARISTSMSHRIQRIHPATSDAAMSGIAARTLSPGTGLPEVVARVAYQILFEIHPESAPGVILANGTFKRGSQQIRGWKQAADTVFGAKTETLTDSELALFCHWISSPPSGWGPDEIMRTRQRLLTRLERRGTIGRSEYKTLAAQPLVLRPTAIPID